MSIRLLHEIDSPEIDQSASVCVIGAGIAGLLAATRLARSTNLKVIVLESGLQSFDQKISSLNGIDNPLGNYQGATIARARGLGGTSSLWAGKLLPLSPRDMLPRLYLNLEGWPIAPATLDAYRPEIESLFGVDAASYEEEVSNQLDPRRLLARDDSDFTLRWPKRPSLKNHNLAHVLQREVAARGNLEIWLGATVESFKFNPSSGRVRSVRAVNHAGKAIHVRATEFILAAGTLECTRLLLLADRQSNHAITRDGDSLGRYFNDHLGLNVAQLHPRDPVATNRVLSDRSPLGALRHLHFELRAWQQEKHRVGSAYFDIGVSLPPTSSLSRLRTAMGSFTLGCPTLSLAHLRDIAGDLPALAATARWQFLHKQKYWPKEASLEIKVWAEQLPCYQNRLSLSDQLDSLQMPVLRFDWAPTDAEDNLFRLMVEKLRGYWQRHLDPLCALEWNACLASDEPLINATHDLAHPAGSTRAGINPATSVVNAELTVHQVSNLSVASASVFPTSGSANPTLTIMELALRTADLVASRLNQSGDQTSGKERHPASVQSPFAPDE